jgi:transcriptional repressor NrdR
VWAWHTTTPDTICGVGPERKNTILSRLHQVICPNCNSPSRVLESRAADGGASTRRRRECTACAHRFTTYERRVPDPLFVIKRDGERQPFDPSKLRAGLLRAAHKRPVSASQVEAIVERIASEVERAGGELSAQRTSELCLSELRELDPGAYLQFRGTLADPDAAISGPSDVSDPGGSVRATRKDAELPARAASRRGNDE